ncbi:type II secretion system F family protein [Pirellulaceae bacterium SH449]
MVLIIILTTSIGICVAAIIGAVAFAMQGDEESIAESRLRSLTRSSSAAALEEQELMIRNPLEGKTSLLDEVLTRMFDVKSMLDQSGMKLTVSQLSLICIGLGLVTTVGVALAPIPILLAPVAGLVVFFLPLLVIQFKRKKRIAKFSSQLPDVLEMLSRSLRAGHSLAAGIGLVAEEMQDPIASEFRRAFEEQKLGVSLETSLLSMTKRVPNLDLRFFATAVILQRTTGGDLAEILDKIGRLVRSRFRLAGQIQALTGEGRLSGVVLLALPPGLFLIMLFLNYEYITKLFTDPMGQRLLGLAILMQLAGAFVIRKIIDIKV